MPSKTLFILIVFISLTFGQENKATETKAQEPTKQTGAAQEQTKELKHEANVGTEDYHKKATVLENNVSRSDETMAEDVDQIEQNSIIKSQLGLNTTQLHNLQPEPCDLIGLSTKKNIPKNCKEIQESGQNKSGMYEIQPKNSPKPICVLCDMETRDGGWIVIQKRYDGSEDFYREWRYYKFGFGNLKREFWLGLENIYHITGFELNELLVEITDRDKIKAYAHYKGFGIGPEIEGYALNILRDFSGDAGDSLTYHLMCKFSTKDLDQDNSDSRHCAESNLGGWWYNDCSYSNLNGKYINIPLPEKYRYKGLVWKTKGGFKYCHAGSRMLVRPTQF